MSPIWQPNFVKSFHNLHPFKIGGKIDQDEQDGYQETNMIIIH